MTGRKPGAAPPGERAETSSLGLRLRQLRQEKQLNIKELAERTGVPASTISKIENGQLKPSLVNAINLATALEVNLGFLVERTRTPQARYSVVRRAQRGRRDFPEIALVLEDLNIGFVPGLLEARIGTVSPGAHSGAEHMMHSGEELVHVLSGQVTYDVDGRTIELARGDSLHFKSDTPHRWINAGNEPAVLVWVFSDGLSF